MVEHTRQACLWAWGREDWSHQVLVATLTLFQPGGADYAHHILMSPPSFESNRRAWAYYFYQLDLRTYFVWLEPFTNQIYRYFELKTKNFKVPLLVHTFLDF